MAVRLVVTIDAAPGKGSELAHVFKGRCAEVMQEPGCEQFEVFQSVLNPDKLALLELWKDQAALDVHAKVNATRAPLPAGLRGDGRLTRRLRIQSSPLTRIRRMDGAAS
jgi:quinol monooxygenase YgiN